MDADRTARMLNRLGILCRTTGRLAQGAEYLREALDVAEKATPKDESLINETLGNLALLLHDHGRLSESEELLRRVLQRLDAGLGADLRVLATARNNLAMLLRSSGQFTEAESLLLEALDGNRRLRGDRDPETVKCVANLGLLYYDMALYDRAEPLLKDALALRQELLGPGDPDLGESLQNLGEFYRITGRLDLAELMLNQALAIWSAAGAERHPNRATTLNNLALLSMARQDWTRAEQFYLQTIDFRREVLGDSHPDLATSLDTLSELYRVTGRYADAQKLCRQGLQMRRALLGDTHPDIAWSLNNLALIEAAGGRYEQAFDLLCESNAVDDRLTVQIFGVGSEAQRLQFLDHLRNRYQIFLSLVVSHLAATPQAVRKAFELVLRRKGLAAEALVVQRDVSLSVNDPHVTSQVHELLELRRELGAKTLAGPAPGETPAQHQDVIAQWQSRREALEAGLARELPLVGWDKRLLQLDASAVGKALPQQRALVEFVRLDVRDFAAVPSQGQTEWQPARYVAFVMLPRDPDAIAMVDLSDAEVLDQCVAELRVSITGDLTYSRARTTESEFDAGTELRRRVFDTLLPALRGSTKILLSPDGDLAILPMEVLPMDDGGRLIDRFEFSYVSSGRDLLRMGLSMHGGTGAPVVAADPDFDLAGEGGTTMASTGRSSRDLDRGHGATRLAGTHQEGEAIADLLGVRPLLGAEVVESRFRGLRSPTILHLATHGFFLKNQTGLRAPPGLDPPRVENPMLRSGLLLAGFNAWLSHEPVPADVEDGMLNGEDVASLNLLNTELVVLSACETGLGDIHVGEGVFGLRRAFALAGARTLVMSLWKVPDQQTRELMIEFYRRILAGEPRAEALRQAQLKIKASHPDPASWAAFICQGDIGPLSLQRPFVAHGITRR
ncbi:MAG TPA: CHAT domain-containing tetratricopeptide repeat protein [Candidatus Sulfotelmatobacter sp.]|jgi:tetratricopeptide (TPR) repeat protein|nr:CHAT domain-containing tetratricopeptide repeat protein [Candidatus Sulfotelmatobacter sp.]